jgi:hypothetical protein
LERQGVEYAEGIVLAVGGEEPEIMENEKTAKKWQAGQIAAPLSLEHGSEYKKRLPCRDERYFSNRHGNTLL